MDLLGRLCQIGIEKRGDTTTTALRCATRRCRTSAVLLDFSEGRLLDLVENAQTHLRAKVEHQFRIKKFQFGFRKPNLGIIKNLRSKCFFSLINLNMVDNRCPCNATMMETI